MNFIKKETSASSSSPMSHPGLKPLRLVDKLIAAQVIQPYLAHKTSPRPKTLDAKKKPRSSVQAPKSSSASSAHRLSSQTGSSVKRPRTSSTAQTTACAPFVVSLNYSASRAPRTSFPVAVRPVRSSGEDPVSKTAGRRVSEPVSRQVVPMVSHSVKRDRRVPTATTVSRPTLNTATRLSKPKVATPAPADKVSVKSTTTRNPMSLSTRSRIPVFTGLSSRTPASGVFTPSSNSTPRLSASRIPRLKYMRSPALSRSSVLNTSASPFNVQTPCPSHILAVEARQLGPRVAPKTETSSTTSEVALETPQVLPDVVLIVASAMEVKNTAVSERFVPAVEAGPPGNIKTAATETVGVPHSPTEKATQPSALEALFAEMKSRLSGVVEAGPSVYIKTVRAETPAGPRSPAHTEVSGAEQASQPSALEALLAELKGRLSGTAVTTSPSTTTPPTSPFGLISKTRGNRKEKENGQVESELQQAFARRRSSVFGPSKGDSVKLFSDSDPRIQERRPLAPITNNSRPHVQTRTPPPPSTSSDACPPSPPSNDAADSTPPGAVYVTELVSTAFGMRKVRRVVIPPIEEGARPSRDPRIVMELNSLRAQQKVGGGVVIEQQLVR